VPRRADRSQFLFGTFVVVRGMYIATCLINLGGRGSSMFSAYTTASVLGTQHFLTIAFAVIQKALEDRESSWTTVVDLFRYSKF